VHAPVRQAPHRVRSLRVARGTLSKVAFFKEMPRSAPSPTFLHLMFCAAPCCLCCLGGGQVTGLEVGSAIVEAQSPAALHRCGSNSPMRLAGCVGRLSPCFGFLS